MQDSVRLFQACTTTKWLGVGFFRRNCPSIVHNYVLPGQRERAIHLFYHELVYGSP